MRILSRPIMRTFWERHPDAMRPLLAWEKIAKQADWGNWTDLKQTFGSADLVGSCVVFDVGNNRYRLIGRVFYRGHRIYILKIMTHADYDRKDPGNKRRARWEAECRCHEPQPVRTEA